MRKFRFREEETEKVYRPTKEDLLEILTKENKKCEKAIRYYSSKTRTFKTKTEKRTPFNDGWVEELATILFKKFEDLSDEELGYSSREDFLEGGAKGLLDTIDGYDFFDEYDAPGLEFSRDFPNELDIYGPDDDADSSILCDLYDILDPQFGEEQNREYWNNIYENTRSYGPDY